MTSNRLPWVAMLVLAGLTGCAMCDNSQDCTYPAFGGKWQRDNLFSGRVASLFDPAGHQTVAPADGQAPTLAAPVPEDAEMAETAESTMPAPEAEAKPESTLEKPTDQESPAMGGAEKAEPEGAEKPETIEKPKAAGKPEAAQPETEKPEMAEPSETADKKAAGEGAKEAKEAKEEQTQDTGLPLPGMPDELPKSKDRKEGGTNLLPPLELPPQP